MHSIQPSFHPIFTYNAKTENHRNLIHRFPTADVAHNAMSHIAHEHNALQQNDPQLGDNIELGC